MKHFTVTTCSDCGRRFVRTIHACRSNAPIAPHWSGRAYAAAQHALEVAAREEHRYNLGLVGLDNLGWAIDLAAKANRIMARLKSRSICPWTFDGSWC